MAEPGPFDDLDVVTVTHNSANHLPAALDALPRDAAVIVVDNCSTDGSVILAKDAGAAVVQSDANAGFAAGVNRGVSLGTRAFVLLLNPDAEIEREELHKLLVAMRTDDRLAALSPRVRYSDGTEQRTRWPLPTPQQAWIDAMGGGRFARRRAPSYVIGACLLVRRTVFEELHGFDVRFWLYGEEADFCRRALNAGWRVEVLDDAWCRHVGGASADHAGDLVFEHFQRGAEHYARKHHGRGGVLALRLAHLTGSAARSFAPGQARQRLHRRRLRRVARLLTSQPTTVDLDSPATRAVGKSIVVCSLEAWNDVWRRNQFFVRELLASDPERRILFVEPPYDWRVEWRGARTRRRRRGLRPLASDARIVCFEPGKLLPRVLGPFADWSLRRQVQRAAASLAFTAPALWINDPSYSALPRATGWPALYDITDDWTESDVPERVRDRVRNAEATLFSDCREIIVCSPDLARSRAGDREVILIPNGVDVDHFRLAQPRPIDLPSAPVVVYVGTLHEDRLDAELVEWLATALPTVTVVLVGPDALRVETRRRLEAHHNVVFLGPRPYDVVPGYLQHADAVVVPHVVTQFTESLDPIKAYECLAVGRPTIATPVAGFRDLGTPVEIADRATFVEAVERVLEESPPTKPGRPVSWAERSAAFDVVVRRLSRPSRSTRRVAYIDHCAKLSGGELALARVLPALDDVDAHVILGEHGPLEARLRSVGVAVEVLPLDAAMASTHRDEVTVRSLGVRRLTAALKATNALAVRLRELDPDLVHTNSLKSAIYGGVAARRAGVPVIWHIRDRIADDYLPSQTAMAIRLLSWLIPNAVITNSKATLESLGRLPRTKVIPSPVVYDTVELDRLHRLEERSEFVVVMVGRLAPWKGQDIFLRSFAKAFAGTDARAVIAGSAMFGEDAYASTIEALVDELGLTGRVDMLGFVDDVASVLANADCLVHASVIAEPFGQVVVEGMAAGLPVIASDAGGPREIIIDGVDGLLCPPGDVDALARLLVLVAEDAELRMRIGAAAAEASERFRPEYVAAQIVAVYDELLGR